MTDAMPMWERLIYGEPKAELIAPGVWLDPMKPGGRHGPNRETLMPTNGGQVVVDSWTLGTEQDAFQLVVPDIRMPANQYWPLHWHDCWIAVLILEGSCLIGDWWMQPGDLLISAAELEYGPVVAGPSGVRMFEVFARNHLSRGGYAEEYRDHPTLAGGDFHFAPRAPKNLRNDGRQTLQNAGVDGLFMANIKDGGRWDLGDPADPQRGQMESVRLAPGGILPGHARPDWRAIYVLEGEATLGDIALVLNDAIVLEPGAMLDEIVAGPEGALLFEVMRTAC